MNAEELKSKQDELYEQYIVVIRERTEANMKVGDLRCEIKELREEISDMDIAYRKRINSLIDVIREYDSDFEQNSTDSDDCHLP